MSVIHAQFLREHAEDFLVGGGLVLVVIGLGMWHPFLVPIAAGLAMIGAGVLLAYRNRNDYKAST